MAYRLILDSSPVTAGPMSGGGDLIAERMTKATRYGIMSSAVFVRRRRRDELGCASAVGSWCQALGSRRTGWSSVRSDDQRCLLKKEVQQGISRSTSNGFFRSWDLNGELLICSAGGEISAKLVGSVSADSHRKNDAQAGYGGE